MRCQLLRLLSILYLSTFSGGAAASSQAVQNNYVPCHFNRMCYCKYNEETESFETLSLLWKHSSGNVTLFGKYTRAHDPLQVSGFPRSNGSSPPLGLDWGIAEFFCLGVPLALIPTDWRSLGRALSHLSVVAAHLKQVDGSAFASVEVESVQLNSNELYVISEYAFSSMSNSLTVLDLSANYLDEIPLPALKSLKLLEWLNLSNNKIRSLDSAAGGSSSSSFSLPLRQLILSSNSISNISPLRRHFPALIWLDISSNFIRNLTNLPPNLQTLIAGSNPVSKFPLGAFSSLRSLSWLGLSNCGIESLPDSWPKNIGPTQINQLDLSLNFIQKLPRRPFASNLKIVDLILSKNYIGSLPPHAFHGMSPFRLSLDYNRIGAIDPSAFTSGESSLRYLNLDNNRLGEVPWGPLSNCTNLKHLYLGNNGMEGKWTAMPEGYECSLSHLSLNGNGLGVIPADVLDRCGPTLEHLNLGYNRLQELSPLSSRSFPKLSTLVLRNNPISSLEPGSFHPTHFPSLTELSLSFCSLPPSSLGSLHLPNLTILEVSNGLRQQVDEELGSFHTLPHLEWIALDHNGIKELGGGQQQLLSGNRYLQYANFEFNRISRIPRSLFHPAIHKGLNELRFSHNRIEEVEPGSLPPVGGDIDLSYNWIRVLDGGTFESSSSSSPNIHLQWNRVRRIRDGAFSGEKFGTIDLSFNQLGHFHFNAFGSGAPVLLAALNLSANYIESVASEGQVTILKYLDLSRNRLSWETVNIERVCPLGSLDLSGNVIERLGPSLLPQDCGTKVSICSTTRALVKIVETATVLFFVVIWNLVFGIYGGRSDSTCLV